MAFTLATYEIRRGLSLLSMLNERGVHATAATVNEFARTTVLRNIYESDDKFGATDQDAEVTDFLARVGFVQTHGEGLVLTPAGKAFAGGLEQADGPRARCRVCAHRSRGSPGRPCHLRADTGSH